MAPIREAAEYFVQVRLCPAGPGVETILPVENQEIQVPSVG